MTIQELLETTHAGSVKLLVTATNGLDAHKDKLLAVKLVQVYPERKVETFYIYRRADEIQQNEEFHKLSAQLVQTFGKPEAEIKELFTEAIKDTTLLTYNCGFQIKFIEQIYDCIETLQLYDWTCLEKATRNKHMYTNEECENIRTFLNSCEQCFNAVPVSRYSRGQAIQPGESRMDWMASVSESVFSEVSSREFSMLEG